MSNSERTVSLLEVEKCLATEIHRLAEALDRIEAALEVLTGQETPSRAQPENISSTTGLPLLHCHTKTLAVLVASLNLVAGKLELAMGTGSPVAPVRYYVDPGALYSKHTDGR